MGAGAATEAAGFGASGFSRRAGCPNDLAMT
jgi:hypothetical protein